jgi:predicted acylesterase/phospholipase RssA
VIMPDDIRVEDGRRVKAKHHRPGGRSPFECIASLLPGSGALGSCQASADEALAEADLDPDGVVGISIVAINSALIVGKPPSERVAKQRQFWQKITANTALSSLIRAICASTWPSVGRNRPSALSFSAT